MVTQDHAKLHPRVTGVTGKAHMDFHMGSASGASWDRQYLQLELLGARSGDASVTGDELVTNWQQVSSPQLVLGLIYKLDD